MLLCVGLLLLLIGRIIYLQGSTNSQDHSQVQPLENPADVAFVFNMYLCWIYQILNLLFVYEELIFTLLPFSQLRMETLDSVYLNCDGNDSVTPLRNSNMPEFLLFHRCFSFTVSEPLQCYQRAGILHSFSAQRRSCHLNMSLCKMTAMEIQMCLVQFPVYFFSFF